jgi:hypothetical protein
MLVHPHRLADALLHQDRLDLRAVDHHRDHAVAARAHVGR